MSKITMDEVESEWIRLGVERNVKTLDRPKRQEGWISTGDVAKLWGKKSRDGAGKLLRRMHKAGFVERYRCGYHEGDYWRIVKKGKK